MYTYSINIALNGQHFAKVMMPQGTMAGEALRAQGEFGKRFPVSEGWSVTLTRWTNPVGETIAEQR
jgi:hypothetical protein